MYKSIILSIFIVGSLMSFSATAQDTIEDRVDALEMQGYLEAIRFNSIFNVRTDMVTAENTSTSTKSKLTAHRMYYALDGTANISDKLNFFSRMSITRMFSPVSRNGFENDLGAGLSASRAEGSDGIQLERAYFNYAMANGALVFTAGRLPTVDGPPEHLYDNLPRQGTYPAYAYGSVLDGFALTYGQDTNHHRWGVRGIYTPLTALRYDAASSGVAIPTYGGNSLTPEIQAETPISNVMVEYEWSPSSGSLGGLLFIGQSLSMTGLDFTDRTPRGTELAVVAANPSFGGSGIPNTTQIPTGNAFSGSTLSVDYQSLVMSLEAQDVGGIGLNIGVTNVSTKYTSRGFLESNTGLLGLGNATLTQLAGSLGAGQGFMSSLENEASNSGSAMIITLSYALPIDALNNPTIGFETLSSDQYYQFFDLASHDITNFKATRGSATHFWWSQPLDNGFRWRIGMVEQTHKYKKGFIGAPTASNNKDTTVYSNFRLDF